MVMNVAKKRQLNDLMRLRLRESFRVITKEGIL